MNITDISAAQNTYDKLLLKVLIWTKTENLAWLLSSLTVNSLINQSSIVCPRNQVVRSFFPVFVHMFFIFLKTKYHKIMPCLCFPWLLLALLLSNIFAEVVVSYRLTRAHLIVLKKTDRVEWSPQQLWVEIVCVIILDRSRVTDFCIMLQYVANNPHTALRREQNGDSRRGSVLNLLKSSWNHSVWWILPQISFLDCQYTCCDMRVKWRLTWLNRSEGSIPPRRRAEDGEESKCHPGPGTLWRLLDGTVCGELWGEYFTLKKSY